MADRFNIEAARSGTKQAIKGKVTEGPLEQQARPVGADPGESSCMKAESTPVKSERSDNTLQEQRPALEMKRLELGERKMELEANLRIR